ncbi:DgyrCDS14840 [Dimorphilus gyrociliatus]|uniref:DgyrCDS14840 n=1 Tax=Dimorphilus gyrociliatus TaxID=2664684 RepID=A0A7I8WFF8_9ANNE|nr:DgyrCDS14840 [Dimorphilus gyrociliatus]
MISYTLVCDFNHDCPDKTDESFCNRGNKCQDLTERICHNGQCVSTARVCDNERNCFDHSDEICNEDEAIDIYFKNGGMS